MNTMRLYAVLSSLDINSSGNEKKPYRAFLQRMALLLPIFPCEIRLAKKKTAALSENPQLNGTNKFALNGEIFDVAR